MTYTTNDFLKQLYHDIQPKKNLLNCERSEIEAVKRDGINKLKSLLKVNECKQLFDRELYYEIEDNVESMGIQIDKYRVSAIKNLDFPVYYLKPERPKNKAILYLHGHDDMGVKGAILERYDKVRYHKMIPVKLAKAGYDVFAPDEMGMGEAGFFDFPTGSEQLAGCLPNANYLTLAGFSLAGFRAYQSIRTLDFMEKLGKWESISAFGISGGGMTTQHVFPIDSRLQRAIVACYPNTYENSILAKDHCICNYVPGLLTLGDSAALLSLAAPKKLLAVNGQKDRGFPEAGSRKAFEYLEKVYDKMNALENYTGKLIDGRHEIDEEVILGWLEENA